MTTTLPTDDEIRAALDPIREARPAPGAAARAELAVRELELPRRRLTAPRVAVGTLAAAAVAFGTIAVLPASHDAAHPSALQAAAAVAAEQPATIGGYRYVKSIDRWTYRSMKDYDATISFSVPSQTWVDRHWNGRKLTGESYDIARTGSPEATANMPTTLEKPGEGRFMYGDGPLLDLSSENLPETGPEVTALLERRYAQTQIVAEERPYDILRDELLLLSNANTTPKQRAALYDALSATPGLVDKGEGKDSIGRTGHVVSIPVTGTGPATITVVFDPKTSEILSWSESLRPGRGGAGIPGQEHLFVATGHVDDDHATP